MVSTSSVVLGGVVAAAEGIYVVGTSARSNIGGAIGALDAT
ncbi:hypothetical protein DB32_006130 [Sandaracinus amylolyticus]|uniref:Uncharacterized protein n=1 Tax=Sandaracinus amylolyticus TaxID=927083 RepID=A0A0F6W6U0_9BACT|nr:hypothetical protein DB32_006130 [Sandaracinus amylolyticus]